MIELSLGAGVQSTTVALMAARGDIPMPDVAFFADTGWEPAAVYTHLDWLRTVLPFPVVTVRRPGLDLGAFAIQSAQHPVPRGPIPPWFARDDAGRLSMLPKHCSKEFKTRAVQAEIRRRLGLMPGQRAPAGTRVVQYMGISRDEAHRMKPSEVPWINNQFPLIDAGMTRRDCLRWLEDRQYPRPPKSSCIFCPYRGDQQWRDMRDGAPEDWQRVLEFDDAIRPGFHGMDGQAYVHRSGAPLSEADLSTDAERGQGDLFGEECEGVCGV